MVKQPPNADSLSAPSLAAPPPPPSALVALVLCALSAATGCGAYYLATTRTHGLFAAASWLGWFVVALAVTGALHAWDVGAPRGTWRRRS